MFVVLGFSVVVVGGTDVDDDDADVRIAIKGNDRWNLEPGGTWNNQNASLRSTLI